MQEELIWGIPVLNFQSLLGVSLFLVCWVLVQIIRRVQQGRFPGGAGTLIYLRMLLGFSLTGSLMFFFGALFGFRYI